MPEAPTDTPRRVLVLGWHAATERQLRPLARWYEGRGHAVRVVLTPTFRTMGLPGAWARFGRELAEALEAETRRDPRAVLVHAFSNAGFWTLAALADALDAHAPSVQLEGLVIDSAPGFPEKVPFWFTARYATPAMMPGLLTALGGKPRAFHPLLSPPIAAFFAVWHVLARPQVRFMEDGQRKVRALIAARALPLLVIGSDADALIPREHVDRFVRAVEARGTPVERLWFERSAHVRHLFEHRAEYFARLESFVSRA